MTAESSNPYAPAARILCRSLENLGVRDVFGLPGTRNLALFDELRRSGLGVVAPAHELSAAFMANGYHRASGRPGVLVAVAGPGLAFSLAGLAEARLDSAAVLCLTGAHGGEEVVGRRFQEIPQSAMADPVVKTCLRVRAADELPAAVERGLRTSLADEPGPVLLEIEDDVWSGTAPDPAPSPTGPPPSDVDAVAVRLQERLRAARRPVLIVGQGAHEGATALRAVAESLHAPVLASTSGRGALPEDHPLSFALDRLPDGCRTANALVATSDLVLVLGCKLSHNATWGFGLELPAARLVRIDASCQVLENGYPASESLQTDVPAVLGALAGRLEGSRRAPGDGWRPDELAALRPTRSGTADEGWPEPRFPGDVTAADFFEDLRRALPSEAVLVTDSGYHQMMLRRHFPVLAPRGLIVPSDLQSMGFGVPAAVGAALACPERAVVAVVGDGGVRATGTEVATAARAGASLVVIVLVDGHFGLIRRQQLGEFGRCEGTELPLLDLAAFADALGVGHARVGGLPGEAISTALAAGGVHLLEVPIEDGPGTRRRIAGRRALEGLREALGPAAVARLKQWRDSFGAPAPGDKP